jgi:hypothetical protein
VAFLAGYFGPIVLTPDSNQGPLLGIFFTGPLGFVLGTFGGLAWGLVRRPREATPAVETPAPGVEEVFD